MDTNPRPDTTTPPANSSPKVEPPRPWRRSSYNPFEPKPEPTNDGTGSASPLSAGDSDNTTGAKANFPDSKRMSSWYSTLTQVKEGDEKSSHPVPQHPELKYPGSEWIHLFYDLAWSASFASLTENGTFQRPLDSVNYFLFFAAVLWLWASQTLYSIHFFTNDWFHLTSTFLQLFVFGMLSATTLGYDVTLYIARSPGISTLSPIPLDDMEPQRYVDEKTAYRSILVLAIAFVATRIIHLVQYLRVYYYASWSIKPEPAQPPTQNPSDPGVRDRPWIGKIPPQIKAIIIGLCISNPIFIAALVIVAGDLGVTVLGGSLKLGLWIGGFLIEVVSHFIVPGYDYWKKRKGKLTLPSGRTLPISPPDLLNLCKRLQTITTIILGEGINGIAGTLSAVMVAPGVGRTVVVNVISAACTIWFIAYIYFEGPKGDKPPVLTSLRYMLWLLLHLPFLASTVLLLIGIKNEFLLTGFLAALFKTTSGFNTIYSQQLRGEKNGTLWRTNAAMKHFLLERGLVWEDEYNKLDWALGNATNAGQPTVPVLQVWTIRLSLSMVLNIFKAFNGGDDSIPSDAQLAITAYNENATQVAEDYRYMYLLDEPQEATYYKILSELLSGTVQSTRYIIAFAGVILISLGLQDLIHSRENRLHQKIVIVSRLLMGVVLSLLLLLNIGKYQELFVPNRVRNQRAAVFLWLETFWVLPTIAIGYGLQFLIELAVTKFANEAVKEPTPESPGEITSPPTAEHLPYVKEAAGTANTT